MWRSASLLVLVLLAGVVIGAAASVNLSAAHLGAASRATPRCTSSGLTLTQNLSGASVTSVTVAGIPVACGSATLYASLNNGSTRSSGSAVVAAGGGSVTVTLTAAVPASTADEADIVLTGP